MPGGKAETLAAVIEAETVKLGINLSQVVGLGSDGASVMTGHMYCSVSDERRLLMMLGYTI